MAIDISYALLAWTVWSGLLGCAVYLCIYRLYFHPLSRVPGPKLAALTRFYEAYYNVLRHDGQYLFQTEKMHAVYGPIVRISPNEVSIQDVHFHDTIYRIGSGFEKDPAFYSGFGVSHSMFATRSNALHSAMRASFNPFFSRRNILRLEHAVADTVRKLCARIDAAAHSAVPFDMLHGFKAVSIDVITGFAFDFSYNLLDREDLGRSFCAETEARLGSHWIAMYFPIVHTILPRLPLRVVKWLQPGIQALIDLKERCRETIVRIKAVGAAPVGARETIFHHLLNVKDGPPLSEARMVAEGVIMVGAATDTVGGALTSTVFGILSDAGIRERLHSALQDAFPDPAEELSLLKLEAIPYLNAVIKEGLRKSPGIIARLPRLTPAGGITYGAYHLPAGTSVSMSSYYMHKDASVFVDPARFNPDRWLAPNSRALEKFLVPFSRGSRACLGINLAYCELFLVVGSIFRRYELEIYNTAERDIAPARDYMIGYPVRESRGFRVLAREKKNNSSSL